MLLVDALEIVLRIQRLIFINFRGILRYQRNGWSSWIIHERISPCWQEVGLWFVLPIFRRTVENVQVHWKQGRRSLLKSVGGRASAVTHPWLIFGRGSKGFFPREEVKGVGRPYPVLNSVNSTLCWILIWSQFIYVFIYLFVLKKEAADLGRPPPFCCIVRVQTLENHRYMHATPSASVNHSRVL